MAGDARRPYQQHRPARLAGNAQHRRALSTPDPAQQALQQDALGLVSTFADARRNRLFANEQGIPSFFWVGNLILAAITIGFCFIFRVRSEAVHLFMTLALATVIATIFVLIALFDYPFRGDSQIPPTVFTQLQHNLSTDAY